MTELIASLFSLVRRYFLVDLIFIVASLAFPKYVIYGTHLVLSNTLGKIIDVPFIAKFPFTIFAFVLFILTWHFRKRKLSRDGEIHMDDSGLTGRQIGGRLFLVFTVAVIYTKNYVLNDISATVVPYVDDRIALAFEILYCWVAALIVVDLLNWVSFKLFRRG